MMWPSMFTAPIHWGRIKLLNLAIDSIEISKNGKLSLMTLFQNMLDETGTQTEDIDGFIHYAKRIEDVRVAVLIRELPAPKAGLTGNRYQCEPALRWHHGCFENRGIFWRGGAF